MSDSCLYTIVKRPSGLPDEDRYTSASVREHRTIARFQDVVFDRAYLSEEDARAVEGLSYVKSIQPVLAASIPRFPVEPIPVPVDALAARELLSGPDSLSYLNIPYLHERGITGEGQTVAVLDTGMDGYWGAYLKNAGLLTGARSFVGENPLRAGHFHGSHVAGIVHRVAPRAKFLIGQVLGSGGKGGYDAIMEGIEWAVANGADVINLSLGGPVSDHLNQFTDRIAAETGVLFVVAAGNDGYPRGEYPADRTSPATAKRPLCVASTDYRTGQIAESSSAGDAVDVAAPGHQINSWGLNARYMLASGTSMAAPFVSGVAALVGGKTYPGRTHRSRKLRGAIHQTARDTGLAAVREGRGVVDARAAYERFTGNDRRPAPTPPPATVPSPEWMRDAIDRTLRRSV